MKKNRKQLLKNYVRNREKIMTYNLKIEKNSIDKRKNDIDDDFLDLEFDAHISISGYFVLELGICDDEKHQRCLFFCFENVCDDGKH